MENTEPLFLTADEVETLTGYKRHKNQAIRLAEIGIPFTPNAAGRPIVARAIFIGTMTASTAGKKPRTAWKSNVTK